MLNAAIVALMGEAFRPGFLRVNASSVQVGTAVLKKTLETETTVLFVDDTHDIVDSMVDVLMSWGYRTVAATGGGEAIELANIHEPDIIISDIGMPGIDGYELAQAIRKKSWAKSVLMIAHSGVASGDASDAAINAGFDVFIPKPTDFSRLKAVLSAGRYSF